MTYFAKKCILLLWKNDSSPTITVFQDQIAHLLPLEKLTFEKHNRGQMFQELWSPLMSQLNRATIN